MQRVFLIPAVALFAWPALALDCTLIGMPGVYYRLEQELLDNGRKNRVINEVERGDITFARLRMPDVDSDTLVEMRGFTPLRSVNKKSGLVTSFEFDPISGELDDLKIGSVAMFLQKTIPATAAPKFELVSQKVTAAPTANISGCAFEQVQITRLFEDTAAKTSRESSFLYSPALTVPLSYRLQIPAPPTPRVISMQTLNVEFAERPPER
jgi:hypothetical protein